MSVITTSSIDDGGSHRRYKQIREKYANCPK